MGSGSQPATTAAPDPATRSDDGMRAPGIPDPPPRRLAYLELNACAGAVPQARRHVRSMLAKWDLPDIADDAELVTSELVTNAIAASAALPFRAGVGLLVAACRDRLMLLVWDASYDRPVRHPDDDEGVAGRGVGIVAALSTRWGWVPDGRGKVVWAMLDLGTSRSGGAGAKGGYQCAAAIPDW